MTDVIDALASEKDARADGGWALFLDFDGTLVEIVDRPEAVVVDPALGGTLTRLKDQLGGALAIVTGRPIAVIDGFLAPLRFDVAGLHGVEHRLAGRLSPCRPDDHPRLRAAVRDLPDRLPKDPGVLIEDKGCSVAVHWRLAPDLGEEAMQVMEETAAVLGPEYRLQGGKAVAEILPARAAKGAIIRYFLEHAPFRGRRPIFIGDDLTDERGFAAVNESGGVSIRIGREPTSAHRRIDNPAALRRFLSRWAEQGRIDLQAVPAA
jgi:trehalose 6-phosphate phosphatase